MVDVEHFLQENNIAYKLHEHFAVFTVEEARKYCGNIPGMHLKNLLLKGRKGNNFYLIILPGSHKTDLKMLAEKLGEKKISFASQENLMKKMKVDPGSVSVFGLLNNEEKDVQLFLGREVYESDIVTFHPNRNTATLELDRVNFHKFLEVEKPSFKVITL